VVVGCAVEVALFHAGYFLYDGMSVHVVDDHGARKLQLQGGFTDTAILITLTPLKHPHLKRLNRSNFRSELEK
jgi:hypothetical protein